MTAEVDLNLICDVLPLAAAWVFTLTLAIVLGVRPAIPRRNLTRPPTRWNPPRRFQKTYDVLEDWLVNQKGGQYAGFQLVTKHIGTQPVTYEQIEIFFELLGPYKDQLINNLNIVVNAQGSQGQGQGKTEEKIKL